MDDRPSNRKGEDDNVTHYNHSHRYSSPFLIPTYKLQYSWSLIEFQRTSSRHYISFIVSDNFQ